MKDHRLAVLVLVVFFCMVYCIASAGMSSSVPFTILTFPEYQALEENSTKYKTTPGSVFNHVSIREDEEAIWTISFYASNGNISHIGCTEGNQYGEYNPSTKQLDRITTRYELANGGVRNVIHKADGTFVSESIAVQVGDIRLNYSHYIRSNDGVRVYEKSILVSGQTSTAADGITYEEYRNVVDGGTPDTSQPVFNPQATITVDPLESYQNRADQTGLLFSTTSAGIQVRDCSEYPFALYVQYGQDSSVRYVIIDRPIASKGYTVSARYDSARTLQSIEHYRHLPNNGTYHRVFSPEYAYQKEYISFPGGNSYQHDDQYWKYFDGKAHPATQEEFEAVLNGGDPVFSEEPEPTEVASGECGPDTFFKSYSNGLLRIYGSGPITSYPWNTGDIRTLMIEYGVTNIGPYAFADCSNLEEATIPDSVTVIGDGAFVSCVKLTGITIPESVSDIGDYAFADCGSLRKIVFLVKDTSASLSCGARVFEGSSPVIFCYRGSPVFEWSLSQYDGQVYCLDNVLTVPESVTSVESEAFACLLNADLVFIPSSVTNIAEDAFDGSRIAIVTLAGSCAESMADRNGIPVLYPREIGWQ